MIPCVFPQLRGSSLIIFLLQATGQKLGSV